MKGTILAALIFGLGAMPARGGIVLGVHIPPGGASSYSDAIKDFWSATGRVHPLVMFFLPYNHPAEGEYGIAGVVQQVHSVGAVPIITWEFYAGNLDDPNYKLSNIVAGKYDSSIRATAQALARANGEVILRILHEFDTTCYPWGVPRPWNGSAEEFKAAFRHVAEIVHAAGADNVKMMWSPNYTSNVVNFNIWDCYPGDDIVDCVGTSGLNNTPETALHLPGLLFDQILWEFAWHTNWVSDTKMAALTKPQFIVESGTVHSLYRQAGLLYSAEDWIRDSYPFMASRFPSLSGVCWYNGYSNHPSEGLKDFRVAANLEESPVSPSINQAYRDTISDAHYTSTWPGFDNLAKPCGYTSPPVTERSDGVPQLRFVFNLPEYAQVSNANMLIGSFYMYRFGNPDVYLAIKTPSGAFFSYTADRGWVGGIVPAARSMPIHYNAAASVPLYRFTGTESSGTYTVYWALVRAGSKNPVAEVIGNIGAWNFRVR